MKKVLVLVSLILNVFENNVYSRENIKFKDRQSNRIIVAAGCSPSTSRSDLDIGNVRTPIWITGEMWWDLAGTGLYEIPKGSGKSSLFSGALWIGGKDGAGNLKIAAQTYRQSGSDFWPGPVDTTDYSIDAGRCQYYDRHWKITRQEVYNFINGGPPSQVIQDWPGNGDPSFGEANFLAPFHDQNGDGIYDYNDGDYPKYNFGTLGPGVKDRLNGDQTIWWVFNDVGNIHNETNSIFPIGVEIRAQAYAFCTSDSDLNNTTFYSYEIINRSTAIIYQTYLGQFTDVDLGNYLDDYVGCDVGRNLGYGYNGDANDEGALGYGMVVPAVGIDILQGPLADVSDSIDNNHNGIVDEQGEENTMSKFIYYNNDGTVTGNPSTALHHYNYLTGIWKDNSPLVYGGTGFQSPGTILCNYMFPGNSDPLFFGTNGVDPGFDWSERLPCDTCPPNIPSDRRFLMSSGEFTMVPGGVYNFTKAAVWAQIPGGPDSSLQDLLRADDKIQNFFDSNFSSISTCSLTIGINEIQQINHSIYPSPAKNYFIIQMKEKSKKVFLKVFSNDGKLIYSYGDVDTDFLKIRTTEWSSGIYFYQLTDGNNKRSSGKITIIRD